MYVMGIKVLCSAVLCVRVWDTIYFRQLLQGSVFPSPLEPRAAPCYPECAMLKDTHSKTRPWKSRKRFKGGGTDRNFTPRTLQTQTPISSRCQGVPEIPLIFHSCHMIVTFCLEVYKWYFQCLRGVYKRLEKDFSSGHGASGWAKIILTEGGQS